MHEKYDLKGSTHGRTASQKEVSKGVRTIFKDNDFLEKRLRDGTAFNIGAPFLRSSPTDRLHTTFWTKGIFCVPGMATESLLDGLKQDVEFLKAMNLIDYSLLTGVHTFRPVRKSLCCFRRESTPPETHGFCCAQQGWRSGYDYAVGDCVYPPSFKAHRLCFRCLKQGKSQLREPTWPSFGAETATKSPGAEVDEGDILWRCEKGSNTPSEFPGTFKITEDCLLRATERRSLEHLSLDDQERLTWAATKQEVLFFGIIDILTVRLQWSLSVDDWFHKLRDVHLVGQEYRKMKKAEHFFMGTVKGVKKEISCQPSEFYGAR